MTEQHQTRIFWSHVQKIAWWQTQTCRKRADVLYDKTSSFKSQVINCFNIFVPIITRKIIPYLMSVLLSNKIGLIHKLINHFLWVKIWLQSHHCIFREILQHISKYICCEYILWIGIFYFVMLKQSRSQILKWGCNTWRINSVFCTLYIR